MKSRQFLVINLMMLSLWTFPGAWAVEGHDAPLGAHVLSLMRRALAIQLPERLPPEVEKRAPKHAVEEYEQHHRFIPGEGFFEPEFIGAADRDLYRALKKFWSLKPSKQIRVVPYLGEQYFHEGREIQQMMLRLIDELSEDAFDVPARDDFVAETCVKLLERSQVREDKLVVLRQILGEVRIPQASYQQLLGIAREWDHDDPQLRQAILALLAQGRNDNQPPSEVNNYLLEVAKGDECRECRKAVINYWQTRYLGCERVLPTYLMNLDEALRRDDVRMAIAVIRVVGIQGKCTEALPKLIGALSASDAVIRAIAVTALENIVGMDMASIPADFQVFSIDYEKPTVDPAVMARLERAASRWKAWWAEEGKTLLDGKGADEFKKEARALYRERPAV